MIRAIQKQYKFLKSSTVGIVGVSAKEGQNLPGVELAPQKIRSGGLFEVIKSLNWDYSDKGDIKTENIQIQERPSKIYKFNDLKNADIIGAVNEKLHNTTSEIAELGQFCITLGGDHGCASGSISGLKKVYKDLKVIWVDAHSDCNIPETSPSGNYHGMPVAHLLGWIPDGSVPGFDWFKSCLKNEDIVIIGLRDVDEGEKVLLKKHGIKCFSMHDVVKYGISGVMEKTFEYFKKDGVDHPIHISYDVDGIDPTVAYGTGTKARGGLLYREAHYIVREVVSTGQFVSMDVVEVNPLLDKEKEYFSGDSKLIKGTETVCLAIELCASALGYTLL